MPHGEVETPFDVVTDIVGKKTAEAACMTVIGWLDFAGEVIDAYEKKDRGVALADLLQDNLAIPLGLSLLTLLTTKKPLPAFALGFGFFTARRAKMAWDNLPSPRNEIILN